MAFDAFLKLDGIDGESTSQGHEKWIEIDSYSFGAQQSGSTSTGGGAGAGKVSVQDFHFVAPQSKAVIPMLESLFTGVHISSAELHLSKVSEKTGSASPYYIVKLSDVLISGFQEGGGSADSVPTDQFSLNYSKIEWTYRSQSATGSFGDSRTTGYDLKANKKV